MKFNFDKKDFENIRHEAEKFYDTIGDVYCPYFKEKIIFNSKGIKHLKFKSDQIARSQKDQYPRLKLLHFAPEVISISHTLQGIWQTKGFEKTKNQGVFQYLMKDITYYEFIAVIKNVRVKVIIKQLSGGEKYFWSIIPNWGIYNKKRIFYNGNPESD